MCSLDVKGAWIEPKAGAAEGVVNWGSRLRAGSDSKKFFLLIFFRVGFNAFLGERLIHCRPANSHAFGVRLTHFKRISRSHAWTF